MNLLYFIGKIIILYEKHKVCLYVFAIPIIHGEGAGHFSWIRYIDNLTANIDMKSYYLLKSIFTHFLKFEYSYDHASCICFDYLL